MASYESDSYSEGYEQEQEMINHHYQSYSMPEFYNDDNKIAACDLMGEAFIRSYDPVCWLICKGNADDESFYLVLMMVNHNGVLVQHNHKITTTGEQWWGDINPIFMDIRTKQQINDLIGTTYYGG